MINLKWVTLPSGQVASGGSVTDWARPLLAEKTGTPPNNVMFSMVLVLLSAHVKRVSVSCMRDFLFLPKNKLFISTLRPKRPRRQLTIFVCFINKGQLCLK